MNKTRRTSILAILLSLLSLPALPLAAAGLLFDKMEYAARRARLMEAVPDGAAILLGAQPVTGYAPFFQNNDLMYFSGVEIPGAVLVIDGRRKQSTLFFTMSEREARGEGLPAGLVTGTREFTGLEQVAPADRLSGALSQMAGQGCTWLSVVGMPVSAVW